MTPSPAEPRPGERVAIVTGAGDGIGAATARALAAASYRLMLVDVSPEGLERSRAALGSAEVEAVVADVTDEADVAQIVTQTLASFSRVDVLVNVVGGSRPGKTVVELALEEWDRLLALNLTSVFLMCRAVVPSMVAGGGGAIVNVSSGAGLRGMSANPGYVAAKAGVVALTRALAIDHGGQGVRVNCVAPGPVRTPLMARNRTPEEIAAIGKLAIVGRIGEPEEIAAAIVWLAGGESSYLMGQTLEVDGGIAAPL